MGGKGPAIVRYRMMMAEQQSYNFALGNGNWYLACLKLRGMASAIPEEYKVKVPDMPPEALRPVKDGPVVVSIIEWINKQQGEVYKGINKFIEESYAKGELEGEL